MKTYEMDHVLKELEKRFVELKDTQNEFEMDVEDHNKLTSALELIQEVKGSVGRKYRAEKMAQRLIVK